MAKSVNITISGPEDQVDEVLASLAYMSHCCMVGHSSSLKFDFDGDGNAKIKCESDGKPLKDLLSPEIVQMIDDAANTGNDPEFSIGY